MSTDRTDDHTPSREDLIPPDLDPTDRALLSDGLRHPETRALTLDLLRLSVDARSSVHKMIRTLAADENEHRGDTQSDG